MSLCEVQCPNPACPGRSVEGETVNRATWEATWHEPDRQPGFERSGEWGSTIACPRCGTEGIDPESGQLDSAEEELGRRCEQCGVVSSEDRWPGVQLFGALSIYCPECGKLNVVEVSA